MENASKALIIAGAILLSILLISLGIMVYNNAKGTISDANLDSEAAQTFNTKISQYCGKKKNANDMNGLVAAISSSNGAQKGKADTHYILLTVDGSVTTEYYTGDAKTGYESNTATKAKSTNYPNFSAGITYEASYTTDESGFINAVTIKKNGATATP